MMRKKQNNTTLARQYKSIFLIFCLLIIFMGCESSSDKSKHHIKNEFKILIVEDETLIIEDDTILLCDLSNHLSTIDNLKSYSFTVSSLFNSKKTIVSCIIEQLKEAGINELKLKSNDKSIIISSLNQTYIRPLNEKIEIKFFSNDLILMKDTFFNTSDLINELEQNIDLMESYEFFISVGKEAPYFAYKEFIDSLNMVIKERLILLSNKLYGMDYLDLSEAQKEEIGKSYSIYLIESKCNC
jgi:hypothetical protein